MSDNMHIIVTAVALIATVFGWSAISGSEQPLASTEAGTSPGSNVRPSAIIETTTPAAMADVSAASASPTLFAATPIVLPPLPRAKPLLTEHLEPTSDADVEDDEDYEDVVPEHTRAKPPAQTRKMRRHGRTMRFAQAREGQGKRHAATARAPSRNRRVGSVAYIDPFDCRVRKNKPPCF